MDESMASRLIQDILDAAEQQKTGHEIHRGLREKYGDVGEGFEAILKAIGNTPIQRNDWEPLLGDGGEIQRLGQDDPMEPEILPLISAPQIDGGQTGDVLSFMLQTPASSNVYAINFDRITDAPQRAGILYVQYKAGATPTHYTDQTNTCTGEEYKMGHRPHAPGPIYAYGGNYNPRSGGIGNLVPETVFDSLLMARSKGEEIWHLLRVCGSQWEHQYPYTLVSPDTNYHGANNLYVPRKAAQDGYRPRSVATVGQGQRPTDTSTLPATGLRTL